MALPSETVRANYNTAQPEVHEGFTVYPVRPVLRKVIGAEFVDALPTPDAALRLTGLIASQWPQIREEFIDVMRTCEVEDGHFQLEKGPFAISEHVQQLLIQRSPNDTVRIDLPHVVFRRKGGKNYERHDHNLSVTIDRTNTLRVVSSAHAADKSSISSTAHHEPVAFSDVPTVVPFYRHIASQTAAQLYERVSQIVGEQSPFALSKIDTELEVVTLGTSGDMELAEVLRQIQEPLEFEGLTPLTKTLEELARVKAYFGLVFDNTDVVIKAFEPHRTARFEELGFDTCDTYVTEPDGITRVYDAPYFRRLLGSTAEFVAIVPEYELSGEQALDLSDHFVSHTQF